MYDMNPSRFVLGKAENTQEDAVRETPAQPVSRRGYGKLCAQMNYLGRRVIYGNICVPCSPAWR